MSVAVSRPRRLSGRCWSRGSRTRAWMPERKIRPSSRRYLASSEKSWVISPSAGGRSGSGPLRDLPQARTEQRPTGRRPSEQCRRPESLRRDAGCGGNAAARIRSSKHCREVGTAPWLRPPRRLGRREPGLDQRLLHPALVEPAGVELDSDFLGGDRHPGRRHARQPAEGLGDRLHAALALDLRDPVHAFHVTRSIAPAVTRLGPRPRGRPGRLAPEIRKGPPGPLPDCRPGCRPGQRQPQPPGPQHPPPPDPPWEPPTAPAALFTPNTDSVRATSALAQPGQATGACPNTSFSNASPQARQWYS